MGLKRFLRSTPTVSNMLLGRPNCSGLHLHCLLSRKLGTLSRVLYFLVLLQNFLQRNANCLVRLAPNRRRGLFGSIRHIRSLPMNAKLC